MAPRVGGVERRGEPHAGGLDPLGVLDVRGREERRPLPLAGTLGEVPAHHARLGDVAGLDLEPELRGQREVGGVEGADQLAAELDDAAVVEHRLLDAPAGPVARLEHEHVGAGGREVARGSEACQPGAEDQDVVAHRST
jgi:hypothetical protein